MRKISFRAQLRLRPHLRDISAWPKPSWESLSRDAKERLTILTRALQHAVDGEIAKAVEVAGVGRSAIYYLLGRALGAESELESPPLTAALLSNARLIGYTRTRIGGSGKAGLLGQLLKQYPTVSRDAEAAVEQFVKSPGSDVRLTPNSFCALVRKLLISAGAPKSG